MLSALLVTQAGRAYLARVPGVAQAPLANAELAALLNWVLAEWSEGAPRPAYTGAEVGALRRQPLRDPDAVRERLVGAARLR